MKLVPCNNLNKINVKVLVACCKFLAVSIIYSIKCSDSLCPNDIF